MCNRLTMNALLIAMSGLGLTSSTTFAQPEGVIGYDCIDLGLWPEDDDSVVASLSDDGWVLMTSTNRSGGGGGRGDRAVVWINGKLILLEAPPGFTDPDAETSRISPGGIIPGSVGPSGSQRAVAWVPRVGTFVLNTLPGFATAYGLAATDDGWIAGLCSTPSTATMWKSVSTPTRLGPNYSRADSINVHHEAVGSAEDAQSDRRATLWLADGTMIDLGGPPDTYGYAEDINAIREIVGPIADYGAAVWRDGVITPLPSGGPCGAGAYAINDAGVIAGGTTLGTGCLGAKSYTCIWENDELYILKDGPILHLEAGARLRSAKDINNAGQLAVDVEGVSFTGHGHLLTPYNFNLSDPVPGIAGQVNTIQVTGLQPGQSVRLAAGFKPGAQALPNSSCLGGLLLIQNLKGVLPPAAADNSGTATFVVSVPASLRGQTLRLQAYDTDNCEISHTVEWTF